MIYLCDPAVVLNHYHRRSIHHKSRLVAIVGRKMDHYFDLSFLGIINKSSIVIIDTAWSNDGGLSQRYKDESSDMLVGQVKRY